MQTSVNLQDPFSYSLVYIFVCFIILIILTVYILKRYKKNKNVKPIDEIKPKIINISKIKNKYLKQLEKIEEKVDNKNIHIRKAYQDISSIIRHFVFEATNIKVQKYTLSEIKNLNMPILYELINEYYKPEFSKESMGDIKSSIEKTRKVMERWN